MPEPKVYAFSQHIGTLCVTHDTNVHKLGIDPAGLLRMINGRPSASKAVVAGWPTPWIRTFDFLERLAEEVRKDLAAK
jgi:hypothetical protein